MLFTAELGNAQNNITKGNWGKDTILLWFSLTLSHNARKDMWQSPNDWGLYDCTSSNSRFRVMILIIIIYFLVAWPWGSAMKHLWTHKCLAIVYTNGVCDSLKEPRKAVLPYNLTHPPSVPQCGSSHYDLFVEHITLLKVY